MKSHNPIRYIYDNLEIGVITFCFSWMVMITSFTVVSRYFFSFTFSWAEQLTRIFFVVITFAGISLAGKRGAHLKVTALTMALPKKLSNIVIIFGDIVTVIFGFLMAYQIFLLVLLQINKAQTFAAVPGLPVWVMYLPGTIFLTLLSIRIIQFSLIPKFMMLIGKGGESK